MKKQNVYLFCIMFIIINCFNLFAARWSNVYSLTAPTNFKINIIGVASGEWEQVPIRTSVEKAAGLSGGEGFQYVHAIAYAPGNPSIAYFSVDTTPVWKSTDGGASWTLKQNGFMAHGARSLIVDPADANTVLAAGFLGHNYENGRNHENRLQGIYRTRDGGENWSLLRTTDFYKQESKGCLFAFDSSSTANNRTSKIYAGSHNEGLLFSEDGGDTWRAVGFQGKHIIDMKENPSRPGELFIAVESDGLYTYYKGIADRIGSGLPTWPRSIAVSPQNPSVVYAAADTSGLYKSTDGGQNFISSSSGLPGAVKFSDVAVSPVNAGIVYLKASESGERPYYSHDGAASWHQPETTNLGNLLEKEGFWFSSPFAPHPTEAYTALTVSNGRARILKTLDGGKKWAYSGSGFCGGRMMDIEFTSDGKMLFGLTDHGVWLTENDGDTFEEFELQEMLSQLSSASVSARGGTIVASIGTQGIKNIAVSHDYGKSWQYFSSLSDYFYFIAINPKDSNVIYAGPYVSRNSGYSWSKLAHTVRAMYPADGNIVYAVSVSNDNNCIILKSADQGRTWSQPYPVCPFSPAAFINMVVDPENSDRIYVATSIGVCLYDGEEWLTRNYKHGLDKDFFGSSYVSSVAVDPNNPKVVYAGRNAPGFGRANGIFRSTDYGMNWKNINSNLGEALIVWSIQINPLDSAVYIGTSRGTWRYNE